MNDGKGARAVLGRLFLPRLHASLSLARLARAQGLQYEHATKRTDAPLRHCPLLIDPSTGRLEEIEQHFQALTPVLWTVALRIRALCLLKDVIELRKKIGA